MSEPTPPSLTILSLGLALQDRQRQFHQFTDSHVKEWAQLQVKHNRLDPADTEREFMFDGFTSQQAENDALFFTSEDWEDTWAYGGAEHHYGETLCIPLDFFDNPEGYRAAAELVASSREAREAYNKAESKKARIALLEIQLANARAER